MSPGNQRNHSVTGQCIPCHSPAERGPPESPRWPGWLWAHQEWQPSPGPCSLVRRCSRRALCPGPRAASLGASDLHEQAAGADGPVDVWPDQHTAQFREVTSAPAKLQGGVGVPVSACPFSQAPGAVHTPQDCTRQLWSGGSASQEVSRKSSLALYFQILFVMGNTSHGMRLKEPRAGRPAVAKSTGDTRDSAHLSLRLAAVSRLRSPPRRLDQLAPGCQTLSFSVGSKTPRRAKPDMSPSEVGDREMCLPTFAHVCEH